MYKVQITFTPEEQEILSKKALQLGYSVTKYIKLLVGREVLSHVERYPTFPLSKTAIKKVTQAHRDHASGKTVPLGELDMV